MIRTARVHLRPFTVEDRDDVYTYAKQEDVGPNAGWAPHQSPEESEEVIRFFLQEGDVWAIEHHETGAVIGSFGLHDRSQDGSAILQKEIGYVLSPDYWGQGIIPEVVAEVLRYSFKELQLQEVWCAHYDFNHRSRRVNEKCGFRYQFKKPKTLERLDGRVVTCLYYRITAEEWYREKH